MRLVGLSEPMFDFEALLDSDPAQVRAQQLKEARERQASKDITHMLGSFSYTGLLSKITDTRTDGKAARQKELDQQQRLSRQREALRASVKKKLENKSRAELLARSKARRERQMRDADRAGDANIQQNSERRGRKAASCLLEAGMAPPINVWSPAGGRSPVCSPRAAARAFQPSRSASLPISRPPSSIASRSQEGFKRDELVERLSASTASFPPASIVRPPASIVLRAQSALAFGGGGAGAAGGGEEGAERKPLAKSGYESPITPTRSASAETRRRGAVL